MQTTHALVLIFVSECASILLPRHRGLAEPKDRISSGAKRALEGCSVLDVIARPEAQGKRKQINQTSSCTGGLHRRGVKKATQISPHHTCSAYDLCPPAP